MQMNDMQIWIAICGVHMAESLFVGRNLCPAFEVKNKKPK